MRPRLNAALFEKNLINQPSNTCALGATVILGHASMHNAFMMCEEAIYVFINITVRSQGMPETR